MKPLEIESATAENNQPQATQTISDAVWNSAPAAILLAVALSF